MQEKVLNIALDFYGSLGVIEEEFKELQGKRGTITTSPLICCLIGLLRNFEEDAEDLSVITGEGKTTLRHGRVGDIVVYRDTLALENYFRFEEDNGA